MPVPAQPELLIPQISKSEHQAIKSLARGQATEHQQMLALKAITHKLCRSQDLIYIPDDPSGRATAFLAGRSFVGNQILRLLNVPIGKPDIHPEKPNGPEQPN